MIGPRPSRTGNRVSAFMKRRFLWQPTHDAAARKPLLVDNDKVAIKGVKVAMLRR